MDFCYNDNDVQDDFLSRRVRICHLHFSLGPKVLTAWLTDFETLDMNNAKLESSFVAAMPAAGHMVFLSPPQIVFMFPVTTVWLVL